MADRPGERGLGGIEDGMMTTGGEKIGRALQMWLHADSSELLMLLKTKIDRLMN